MTLRIALVTGETSTDSSMLDIEWKDLLDILEPEEVPCTGKGGDNPCTPSQKECPHKKGRGWIPAELKGRKDADVKSVNLLVLDCDHVDTDKLKLIAGRLEPYRYILHSTHSHNPPDDQAIRIVIALSRPVRAAEWTDFYAAATAKLDVFADPVCKNPGRIYFFPRVSKGAEKLFASGQGWPLDVAALIGVEQPAFLKPVAPPDTPVFDDVKVVELDALRADIRQYARDKKAHYKRDPVKHLKNLEHVALLERLLNGEALAEPGERNVALNRTMTLLAHALPLEVPWSAVQEICRGTIIAISDPDDGVGQRTQEAERQFLRAQERRREMDVENERVSKWRETRIREMFGGKKEKPDGGDGIPLAVANDAEPAASEQSSVDDPDFWKVHLKTDKNDKYRSVSLNVAVILVNDPDLKGHLRWNELKKDIEVTGGPFQSTAQADLDTSVGNWLTSVYDISVESRVVRQNLLLVARLYPIDPVRDYLTSLTWDGKGRLDDWLIRYAHAETVNANGDDIGLWVRELGKRWLISAVARALQPGCQADVMLILEGAQGLKKSSLCRVLGGEWFSSDKLILGDKDSKLQAAQTWMIEIAELAALKQGEKEVHKGFLTQTTDKFRPPYAHRPEVFPRRCVFIGSVNPDDDGRYLVDDTGNRRYMPVRINQEVDIEAITADRDQLFAETVARFQAGEKWWFDRHEWMEFERLITHDRVIRSVVTEEAVAAWWGLLSKKLEHVTTHAVAVEALGMNAGQVKRQDEIRIGAALKQLGFTRERVRAEGGRAYAYKPPARLMSVAKPERNHLALIAGAKIEKETHQ